MRATMRNARPRQPAAPVRACWECDGPVPPLQSGRAFQLYRAFVCHDCEPWVASILDPHGTLALERAPVSSRECD